MARYSFKGVGTLGTTIEQERASGRVADFVRVARENLFIDGERLARVERTGGGVRAVFVGDFGGIIES